nr:ribonuclease H-like domain, reverse transcriptase, RNA-dependent DNA polymerase [Tanacetum cinerariifolium]
ASKIYNLIIGADTEEASTAGDATEFALMGVSSEVHNCPFGCENKYNELNKQYNELNEQNGEYFIQVQAYKNSLKTLEKQKRVLQRNQLTLKDKIKVLSIELKNTSNLLKHSERINADVETAKKDLQTKLDNHLIQTKKWRNSSKNLFRLIDSRHLFHRFTKADSMKVVPLPLSGDYTSLSDYSDLDESQMSYGTKSSTSSDSKSMSNDFVSCDDSDKSLKVNTNNFASSDSSVKSSKPNPNDSTSYASTSNVSTSEHEAKIESNIKDCDFYEKQMVNKTVGIGVGPVHSRNKVNHPNQFVPQAVLLRTGKVTIPPTRPQPVPTSKPKVFAPVPTGSRPTSSYFQTYTPYVPTMSYNHMKYGGDRWETPVKPSVVSTLHCDQQPVQNLNPTSTSSMAALRYRDEHNKVGYLLKPTGSDDYHQIINFLRASHIRSPELGPSAIQATIDMTPYTITKDLVKSRLQLDDDGGIDDLPIAKIYSGMDNLGQQTSDPNALVSEHDQSSDPNTASFDKNDAGPFTNAEDEPLGGSFHMSSPRSTQATPTVQPSGGAEDPITLTALSSVVSTLVHKVNSLETKLKDHKKLFKYVVGKLVKKVKSLEVKLMTKKRKLVVSDSDQDEGRKQDVDLDALRALANAVVTVDSNISPGGASSNPATSTSVASAVPTGASPVPTHSLSIPADVPPSVAPVGVSHKGKALMVDEDILVKARTFKQMEEDRLSEEAAKRMAALIKGKRQALAEKLAHKRQNRPMTQAQQRTYMQKFVKNQSCDVYSTGWSMARVKSFTDAQLKEKFKKIQKAISNTQIQDFSRTLKRTCPVRKSLARKRLTKPKYILPNLDLDADAQTFIKVASTEDSDDEAPPVWSALIGDLQVLFDSHEGETVSGEVLCMFTAVSYPLSVKIMEKMLRHKLEIDKDVVGNDMTTAEQLIQFIKNQLAAAHVSFV